MSEADNERASVLLIEDRREEARKKIAFLEEAGHGVEWVNEPSDPERMDSALKCLRQNRYDFLILDINLEDQFGGIHIYNKLIAGECRDRWMHTLVWSMYTGQRIKEATYGQFEFPIRIFVDTAGIPALNVFSSMTGGSGPILKRIEELMSLPPDPCFVCGGRIDFEGDE